VCVELYWEQFKGRSLLHLTRCIENGNFTFRDEEGQNVSKCSKCFEMQAENLFCHTVIAPKTVQHPVAPRSRAERLIVQVVWAFLHPRTHYFVRFPRTFVHNPKAR
jgi:hypothetical protein